jgi:2-dehydro-3-deoxyglucarate aldolase
MPPLKERLARKEPCLGSWVSFDYTATTEFMARQGFEYLVVDLEHTAIGAEGMWRLIQVIELAGSVPLVRVGANDPLLIKRALDSGAHGVLVPMIMNRAEAEAAVRAAYYPPRGTRGVGLWRAQEYGAGFDRYKARAAAETVVILQIEHWRAVDQLEDILSVEGVDGFMIGPYDLSGSLGDPGNFQNSKFLACLEKVEQLAREHRKPAGYHIVHTDPEGRQLREKLTAGYRFIIYGTDMIFFTQRIGEEYGNMSAVLQQSNGLPATEVF